MTDTGSKGHVRLLADDLTGALDSGAKFWRRFGAISVCFDSESPTRQASLALDCGTRDASAETARLRNTALADFYFGADVAMRKVDTLMRGHTFEEVSLNYRLGNFRSGIFAPAFPEQERITRDGRQWSRQNSTFVDVSGSLTERFRAAGLTPVVAASPEEITGEGFFICDAATKAELESIVTAGKSLQGPVLWCGAAGLAEALGGGASTEAIPQGPSLTIVGSFHQRSCEQLAMLGKAFPLSTTIANSTEDPVRLTFANGGAVLGFDIQDCPAPDIPGIIHQIINSHLAAMPSPPGYLGSVPVRGRIVR